MAGKAAPREVKLGSQVEDRITGFTGIVTQICDTFTSGRRFGVTPRKTGEAYPDSILFDAKMLVWKGAGVEKDVTPAAQHDFALGDMVRNSLRVSDEGTVTAITTFINGCVHLEVERPAFVRETHGQEHFTMSTHIAKPKHLKKAAPALKPSGTGGPNQRIPAARVPR